MKKQRISKKDIYKYDIHMSNQLQPIDDGNVDLMGYVGYEVNVSLQGNAMSATSDYLYTACLEHTPVSLKIFGLRDDYYVTQFVKTDTRDAFIFEAELRLMI